MVLEEAAFIGDDVWMQVILPLMQMDKTGVVGISTPQDSGSFYTNVIETLDDQGNHVFETMQLRAACQKCIDTLDDPSKCPHENLERPPWQSESQVRKVEALYGAKNKQLAQQELYGMSSGGGGGVFVKKAIKHLFNREREALPASTTHVYIAVDPSGGGASKFAMVSGVMTGSTMQVAESIGLVPKCSWAWGSTSECMLSSLSLQTLLPQMSP